LLEDRAREQPSLYWPDPGSDDELYVDTAAGAVHVRRFGAGPPVVLLHSNGHSWHEFTDAIDTLAPRFHVHAWDMPGQGESDPAHPRTSIPGYAAVLLEMLDALELHRPLLVGCSIGAFIAADLAMRHPGRAAGVGLVEFAFRDPAWWRAAWSGVCDLFNVATQSPEQIAARLIREPDQALVERWNQDRNVAGVRHLIGVMWAIRQYDMASAISSLEVPILVVFGDSGPTLECRPALERVLPESARIEVIAQAGHFVSIDQPERFAHALATFHDAVLA
jgi:3-oxoadipate enol-lactonase